MSSLQDFKKEYVRESYSLSDKQLFAKGALMALSGGSPKQKAQILHDLSIQLGACPNKLLFLLGQDGAGEQYLDIPDPRMCK